jgi:hypothetical protein
MVGVQSRNNAVCGMFGRRGTCSCLWEISESSWDVVKNYQFLYVVDQRFFLYLILEGSYNLL